MSKITPVRPLIWSALKCQLLEEIAIFSDSMVPFLEDVSL